MPQRKIQDIIIPRKGGERHAARPPLGGGNRERRTGLSRVLPGREGRGYPYIILWGIAVLALVFLVISLSTFFEGATVTITPKQKTVTLDSQFTASKGGAPNGLSFEIMKVEGSETKTISTTEVKQVDRRASGRITIYNDYNAHGQRLIKNTRFETPEGLIYRIRESIVVPGQKTVGGETLPGSMEVMVYADEPGANYNIGLTDFTIPGFKGTPRYEAFYARGTAEMTGGFSGIVKTVSQEKLAEVRGELQERVRQKLLESAIQKKPETFVLFDSSIFIEFFNAQNLAEQENIGENAVEVSERAVLYGIIFDKEKLSNFLAQKSVSDLALDDRVTIPNIADLDFLLIDKEQIVPTEIEQISFSLKGDLHIVWSFDEEQLRHELVGQSKDRLKTILAQFPSIARAEVVLRPFWKRSFSEDPGDITIEQRLE